MKDHQLTLLWKTLMSNNNNKDNNNYNNSNKDNNKKFKFDHTNKSYMNNPAPVLENATHKLLWDFNIQTDHLIPARRPDLIIINKKKRTCKIVDFAVPVDHRIKLKECEKKDKYFDLARELKKTMKHAGDNYTNCNWCVWNSN